MKLSLSSCSGNTPLIKVSERVYAKLETFNPTGSVKDRVITYLVSDGIRSGQITHSSILCEATSGNTGIALAACAANLGLKCFIFMPENMSVERKQMMSIYGAEIIDAPADDFLEAIRMRDEFLDNNKNAWTPNQFHNPKNVDCHMQTTAPEIFDDLNNLGLEWAAIVHGAGTGGTIEGIRRFIESKNLPTEVCLVEPIESPHMIQGIADGKEFLAKASDMDHSISVSSLQAIDAAKRFARETGFLVGISAGANLVASESYAKTVKEGVVVTFLCDRGERYFSIL